MNNQFKPILFSTPMVQAILKGRKTKTRRTKGLEKINENPDDWIYTYMTASDGERKEFFFKHLYYVGDDHSLLIPFPYGKVGDILWVRETWGEDIFGYGYKASADINDYNISKWKPSIHMPKKACRLFLEITSINVERLHDINEEDAIAEGIERIGPKFLDYDNNSNLSKLAKKEFAIPLLNSPINSFKTLWTSINGIESWNANPWVWAIELKRIEKPVNF